MSSAVVDCAKSFEPFGREARMTIGRLRASLAIAVIVMLCLAGCKSVPKAKVPPATATKIWQSTSRVT